MDFNTLYEIKDKGKQTEKLYEMINEDVRLNHSKAARVEFYTNVKYIEESLTATSRILDVGAGAGEYSLYFAQQGYQVDAIELCESNIIAFKKKIKDSHNLELRQGNALDLSCYEDNSFDVVLVFGPLYHLHTMEEKQKCIAEAKRVCKNGGTIFYAFISNDMVIACEFSYNENYFNETDYNHKTFKLEDFPFVFVTANEARKVLESGNVNIIKEVASDGLSEMLSDKINQLDDYGYQQYLNYHFYCCEKPELFGYSSHLLFIEKNEK